MSDISVLGLGLMGGALARALQRAAAISLGIVAVHGL